MWQRRLMTDMRMERNTVKQIKKTWDKKERESVCVWVRERGQERVDLGF